MFTYITQAGYYIKNFVESLDDSVDPFKKGDLIEVTEEHEYVEVTEVNIEERKNVEVLQPEVKQPVSIKETAQKKPRAKAIESKKYAKNKGEKVPEWRRRIIPIYNEIKKVDYNAESKFYTTARINEFIKEIEEIEAEGIDAYNTRMLCEKKEQLKEAKMEKYKDIESGKSPNHPKYYMMWLTMDEYDKLRIIYRNREYEKEKKLGRYNDAEIWRNLDMEDTRDFEYLGSELERYEI